MTRTIAHRELRNNSSAVLREVRAGATIEITNHGEVVAIMIPPRGSATASLRVREASTRGGFGTLRRVRREQTTGEVLDDLRGDR